MTTLNPTSNDKARHDGAPSDPQNQRSAPIPAAVAVVEKSVPSQNVAASGAGGSSPAPSVRPNVAAPQPAATPVKGSGRDSTTPGRSVDASSTTNGGASSQAQTRGASEAPRANSGAPVASQDSSPSSPSADGTVEAVRCLIRCVEQIVQEIPRGSAARLDGVTEGIRKANRAIGRRPEGESKNPESKLAEGSRVLPRSHDGAPMVADVGPSGITGSSAQTTSTPPSAPAAK